jgi:large subunit ribosomal protein L1
MARRSKRYKEADTKVDREKQYPLAEAVGLLKSLPHAKFDESVDIAMQLGIDPKQADQMLRGTLSLPKGTGRTLKVIVFAEGKSAEEAQAAGAIEVGGPALVEKVEKGWMEFDVAVATPAMMQHVRKLGRVLGPKGKMPTPKTGTVTDDVKTAVTEFRMGKIEFKSDDTGNIHAMLGKMSFTAEDLVTNAEAFIQHITKVKPAAAKGKYIKSASLSSSMGPSVNLVV